MTHTLHIQAGNREPVDYQSYGSAVIALNKWASGIGCIAHSGQTESEPFTAVDAKTGAFVAHASIRATDVH